jgi:two-component sensor histidine kinase
LKNGIIVIEAGLLDKDKYRLVVRDNGVGLPENFDLASTKTLGMQMVKELVKQIKGTIHWTSEEHTEFRISF